MTYVATYLSSAAATGVLTPLLIRWSRSGRLIDHPEPRKVHRQPTSRVGGIAIFLGTLLGALFLLLLNRQWLFPSSTAYVVLAASAACVFITGLLDDRFGISGQIKLLVLCGAAAAACAAGLRISALSLGSWFSIDLGVASMPLTMLWIVGVSVAMNFIDGLDGLAAGIAAVACGTIAVVAAVYGAVALTILCLALLGSLTAFLCFNVHPARVFMGDSGSMFVGFMVACLAVLASHTARTVGLALPALALGVPLLDALATLLRRGILQRRSLFAAERGHIHHRLLDLGLNHRRTVLLIHSVTLLCAAAGVAMLRTGNSTLIVGAALLMLVFQVVLFHFTGAMHLPDLVRAVRHNRRLRSAARKDRRGFERLELEFQAQSTFEGWWAQVCSAADAMGLAQITLSLTNRDGTPNRLTWRNAAAMSGQLLHAALPLDQRRAAQSASLLIDVHITGSMEDAGRRMTLFARLVEENSLATLRESDQSTPLLPNLAAPPSNLLSSTAPPQDNRVVAQDADNPTGIRVAVVHDFLYTYGGAERVLEQILNIFPDADLFSLFDFLPPGERGFIRNKPVVTSFLQRLPSARRRHRSFLPLMPLAIEQLDLSEYDLVISSSYVAAKGVMTRPHQLHISYCHSPVRFAWDLQNQYLDEAGMASGLRSLAARAVLHYIRNWDARSANNVDVFVTNSQFVSRRVEKYYRRRSTTIHPPVDVHRFSLREQKEDYYFTASRMVPYKKIDLIVEAFSQTPQRRLIVAGDGPDMARIKAKAGSNIKFVGHVSADRLRNYMQWARAFVFAAEEDFGIVAVEAQACGTPVIAFGRGGATETIVDGVSGIFFQHQNVPSLLDALDRFEVMEFDPHVVRAGALRFSSERFRREFFDLVEQEWQAFTARLATDPAGEELPAGARAPLRLAAQPPTPAAPADESESEIAFG